MPLSCMYPKMIAIKTIWYCKAKFKALLFIAVNPSKNQINLVSPDSY